MSFELSGNVVAVYEKRILKNDFQVIEFVIETDDDKYPQKVKFQAVKNMVETIENLVEGQHVTVSFGVRGNDYNGVVFNNLNAWKIVKNR